MSKGRFEAFSDSVFAFAITLLVLGFVLPEFRNGPPSEAELTRALLRLWPSFVAYALSFGVIGIMWQNHHALFRLVGVVDRATILLNLGLLGTTVFIPFATASLGAYPTMRPSTFLYGLTLTSTATFFDALLTHLTRSRAFASNVMPATIRQTTSAYRVAWTTYGIATLVSLVAPILSFALYLAIVGYFLVPRGRRYRQGRSARVALRAFRLRRPRRCGHISVRLRASPAYRWTSGARLPKRNSLRSAVEARGIGDSQDRAVF